MAKEWTKLFTATDAIETLAQRYGEDLPEFTLYIEVIERTGIPEGFDSLDEYLDYVEGQVAPEDVYMSDDYRELDFA